MERIKSRIGKVKQFIRIIYNKIIVKKLKNKDFSIIASNCNGTFLLHDLGLRFNSPFVNLWMKPDDFIRFLSKINHYLSCEMTFVEEADISYPIGLLDDVRIYFQHYSTKEVAKEKWVERSNRINFNNLFIMFTDRDGCTYQNLRDFDALPLSITQNQNLSVHELGAIYFHNLRILNKEKRCPRCQSGGMGIICFMSLVTYGLYVHPVRIESSICCLPLSLKIDKWVLIANLSVAVLNRWWSTLNKHCGWLDTSA